MTIEKVAEIDTDHALCVMAYVFSLIFFVMCVIFCLMSMSKTIDDPKRSSLIEAEIMSGFAAVVLTYVWLFGCDL